MKKFVILLSLISSPVITPCGAGIIGGNPLKTSAITSGEMAGSNILYQDQHKGYICGILVDREGNIRHFITSKKSLSELTKHEVEPLSPDISKDVYNSAWLNVHYWPKCPILTDRGVRTVSGG